MAYWAWFRFSGLLKKVDTIHVVPPKPGLCPSIVNRAKETLEEAKLLAEKQRWNSAINRLYYAAYYAIIALLFNEDYKSTTHNV